MDGEQMNNPETEELKCPEWDGNLRRSPCDKYCPYRSPGCHAKNKEYARYRAAKDAEVAKRNAIRAGRYSMNERLLVNHKLIDRSKRGEIGR